VDLHFLSFICKKCGRQQNNGCGCSPSLCEVCGLDAWTQCECNPPKRAKPDSEDSGKVTDPEERIDQRTNEDGKPLDLNCYDVPDTCDMIAQRDITGPGQIFSTYSESGNSFLLTRYGFIDPESQSDTVNLVAELFDDADDARKTYWKEHGFALIEKLSLFNERHFYELDLIKQRDPCPPQGDPFVRWTVALGLHGWVRFPLKVWIVLRLLSSADWDKFISYEKLNDKVSFLLSFFFFLDIFGDLTDSDTSDYSDWLELLNQALQRRQELYGDFPIFGAFRSQINRTRWEYIMAVSSPSPYLLIIDKPKGGEGQMGEMA
jgi:hypothetical protein